jgi:hypothetical protein
MHKQSSYCDAMIVWGKSLFRRLKRKVFEKIFNIA